jgi:hypothetical protein
MSGCVKLNQFNSGYFMLVQVTSAYVRLLQVISGYNHVSSDLYMLDQDWQVKVSLIQVMLGKA